MNSYWKLYKKENKITIEKICANAGYERTTFYRHFKDIPDLLDQLENEVIDNIKDRIKNKNSKNSSNDIIYDGFKRFSDNYGEYIVVFHKKGNINFYNKFKELIKKDVFDYLNYDIHDEDKKEILFEFVFSSLINSYIYWCSHKDVISLESFI